MLKGGTWSGNVVLEPLSYMDSAGSCDSVSSINSGSSDVSMEHLSPEERACLMFLEETIEALEVQEDSGFSNDEPDSSPKAEKEEEIGVHDLSKLMSKSGIQGPLTHVSADPAPTLTTQSKSHHHPLNQNSEPHDTPASVTSMKDTEEAQTSPPFPDSAAGCVTSSAVNPTEVQGLTLNGGLGPEEATSTWSYPGESSENDLSIIPPPSDFMDELDSTLQPEKVKDIPLPAEFFIKSVTDVELEQLQSTESAKTISLSSPVTEDPPSSPPPVLPPLLQMSPTSEFSLHKSAPVVAPKPKKLPANILLKSQKPAAAGSDGDQWHTMPTSSDRTSMDPQKIRMEALRKLGLLKSHEEPTGHTKSSKLLPKTRQSWTGPSPLKSQTTSLSPPMTPSYNHISSPPPTSGSLQSPPAVLPPASPTQDHDILPAPAAFSDPIESLSAINQLPTSKDVTDGAINTPPLTSPALVKEVTPLKVMDMKSASYRTSQNSTGADQGVSGEQSLKQICSSQPQPTSVGNGKEFSYAKGEDLQAGHASSKQPNSRRPPYAAGASQHSRESAKLPRSQGISVLICPRAENEEDRRKALKKLGLLRD